MSDAQKLKEVKRIIQKYFKILESLPKGKSIDPIIAKELGIPEELIPIIDRAYKYGKMGENVKLSNVEIDKKLQETAFKNQFIKVAEEQFSDSLENTLNKIREKLTRNIYEEYKKNLTLTDEVFKDEVLPKRYMAGILRQVTDDSKQDFDMVVRTELINNKIYGQAHKILQGQGVYGESKGDTTVFKRPNPDACNHCKKHYLEKDGITPKLFKLSELMANGSNYGKKVNEWEPTLGILHPYCQCQLHVMPEGCEFDETGQIAIKKAGD